MPIIRKVLEVGNSKAVTIPKSWFEFYEKETGQKISEVTIEVNRELKILPYAPKEKEPEKNEPDRSQ
jgi:antitoxin component of MazEF toxin-antitoxin module